MFEKNYARYYEAFNQAKPYKKEIEFVYKWAERPKRILDLGCGTAHYWDYWPDSVSVVGIDRSKDMIRLSKYSNLIYNLEIGKSCIAARDYDLVTALFDVVNYIPTHDWWDRIPVKKGGFFIFDVWDKRKVDKDGFVETKTTFAGITRTISPLSYDGKIVELQIDVEDDGWNFREIHKMYVYSEKDIQGFCGKAFEIADVRTTKKWQKWFKLKRK